jgi:hypothetical protein
MLGAIIVERLPRDELEGHRRWMTSNHLSRYRSVIYSLSCLWELNTGFHYRNMYDIENEENHHKVAVQLGRETRNKEKSISYPSENLVETERQAFSSRHWIPSGRKRRDLPAAMLLREKTLINQLYAQSA